MIARVDVHHHVLPAAWIAAAKPHKPDATWQQFLLDWTPRGSVEQMDRFGIAYAVTELGLPGVWWAEAAEAARLARLCNEYVAEMGRDFPRRFGMFATIPLPYVDLALAEIAYALDVLGADGIGMLTSYGDVWPGDSRFETVFAELDRRAAVVHVHPTVPDRCIGLLPGVSASTLEYLFDTSRAITSLLYNGTFTRYPRIRFIFSHAGGTFPMLAWRIGHMVERVGIADRFPEGIASLLRRLYFDTATSFSPATFEALRHFTSIDRILLGTDYPYVAVDETVAALDATALRPEEAYAINVGNALELFPHLRTWLSEPRPEHLPQHE